MQNVTDQIAQSEPAKNVAITTPGLTPHALTRPPVRPQSHIYSNISPKLGSKTFESLPFETLYQNSVKFQTLPHRSSSAKSSFELSPDSPPSRLPRVESRDLHPSVLLAELSHIYSIPKKEPANTSAAGCSRDYEENSKQVKEHSKFAQNSLNTAAKFWDTSPPPPRPSLTVNNVFRFLQPLRTN